MDRVADLMINGSRRAFLRHSAAVAAGAALGTIGAGRELAFAQEPATPPVRRSPVSPQAFKEALVGPIFSIPTPFNEKFELDAEGLTRGIRRAKKAGVRNFAATAGNSQYSSLDYEEIKQLMKICVDAVAGEGLFIAASDSWWTDRTVEFAKYVESIGATALQLMIPARSSSEAHTVKHFQTVAQATRLPLVLHGIFSESLLKELVKIDSLVAMKEDGTLDYFIDRQIAFGDRIRIFGGGGENRIFVGRPYGAVAFYSTYTTFAPNVSMQFWQALQSGDEKKAVEITLKYDYPFIKRFTHSFWHATLEHFGVGGRYLRAPQETYSDEKMKEVKAFFDAQGVKPSDYA